MKKFLFLSFAALLFVGATKAQTSDTTATRMHKHSQQHRQYNKRSGSDSAFYQKLNLSADQQSKMDAIKADQKTKAAAIKNNSSLTADQKKQQLKALNQSAYEQRQAVYTPEQKAIIQDEHNKEKAAHKQRKAYHKQQSASSTSTPAPSGN
jgi:Spy/CpxP family protein refolding chaperone